MCGCECSFHKVFVKDFFFFKKSADDNKSMKIYPARKELSDHWDILNGKGRLSGLRGQMSGKNG